MRNTLHNIAVGHLTCTSVRLNANIIHLILAYLEHVAFGGVSVVCSLFSSYAVFTDTEPAEVLLPLGKFHNMNNARYHTFLQSLFLTLHCFVQAASPLNVITIETTPNGFDSPARGWKSFGLQANPNVKPDFVFNQANVTARADALLSLIPAGELSSHDYYISLDSGWSDGSRGDENGRILYNDTLFSIPKLADYLHGKDLKLGIYVLPGAFCADENKTIIGTDSTIKDIFSRPLTNHGFARCDLDYGNSNTQTWHDSVMNLFGEW